MEKTITYQVNGETIEISWDDYLKEIEERQEARLRRKQEAAVSKDIEIQKA